MDSEFPGVIDLNVSGTHFRALLSTLTKDEDSELAAMFTGRKPVYKDKDDRYFIEADPNSFNAILHFLLYDELPFQDPNDVRGFGTGFGSFLGRGQGLFGTIHKFTARNIELLYKDSINLGLKRLTEGLLLFAPNFVNFKMDEYRQTIRGYDKTISAILDIVPAETLFHKTKFTIRIKQDLQTIGDERCCEHDCKTLLPTPSFFDGRQHIRNFNAIVKVQFEVNPTILSAFVVDFQRRGYIVQGEIAMCGFECKKEVKQSKYVVFGTNRRNCCTEELFLLHFKWEFETHVVGHSGLFGTKNATSGLAQQNTGFLFGSKGQDYQSNVGLFGDGQAQQNTGFSFGANVQEHQSNVSSFGGGQQSGFGFGASQQQNQGSGLGNTKPAAGFGFTQQQTPIISGSLGFGGGPQQGSEYNTQQSGFFAQSQSFGKGSVTPQNQHQPQSLFNKASNQQGSSLFGSSAFNSQQSIVGAGKNVFGGNQQSNFGQNVQQKGNTASFSFGSPKTQSSLLGPSGQSIFGKSPSKDQPMFGGKPVFQSNFGSPSPQLTTVTVSADPSAVKTSADDKPEVNPVKPTFSFESSK